MTRLRGSWHSLDCDAEYSKATVLDQAPTYGVGYAGTGGGGTASMSASTLSTRDTATAMFSSVVGTSRAGNVATGAFNAWLAAPEFILQLPSTVAGIPSAVGRLADGAVSYAGRLWTDPPGTVSGTLASGVDGLRGTFNQAVYGDGRAMGATVFAAGTAMLPLGRLEAGLPGAVTFEGTLYRAVGQGHDPLLIHPGNVAASHRYTGPGQGGLYFATGQHVVEAEFLKNGASLAGKQMYAFDRTVPGLLDLSSPAVRDGLGVSLGDLTRTGGTQGWRYEVTQPLGSWAQQQGYRGIIAPSAQADGGVILILFSSQGLR